ncbi:MAG: hypothetical protein U1E31_00715 [Rickettsiales bacterium]
MNFNNYFSNEEKINSSIKANFTSKIELKLENKLLTTYKVNKSYVTNIKDSYVNEKYLHLSNEIFIDYKYGNLLTDLKNKKQILLNCRAEKELYQNQQNTILIELKNNFDFDKELENLEIEEKNLHAEIEEINKKMIIKENFTEILKLTKELENKNYLLQLNLDHKIDQNKKINKLTKLNSKLIENEKSINTNNEKIQDIEKEISEIEYKIQLLQKEKIFLYIKDQNLEGKLLSLHKIEKIKKNFNSQEIQEIKKQLVENLENYNWNILNDYKLKIDITKSIHVIKYELLERDKFIKELQEEKQKIELKIKELEAEIKKMQDSISTIDLNFLKQNFTLINNEFSGKLQKAIKCIIDFDIALKEFNDNFKNFNDQNLKIILNTFLKTFQDKKDLDLLLQSKIKEKEKLEKEILNLNEKIQDTSKTIQDFNTEIKQQYSSQPEEIQNKLENILKKLKNNNDYCDDFLIEYSNKNISLKEFIDNYIKECKDAMPPIQPEFNEVLQPQSGQIFESQSDESSKQFDIIGQIEDIE